MEMLIADSGSSITDWTVLSNGTKVLDFQTQGLNPYVHSLSEIEEVLSEVKIVISTPKCEIFNLYFNFL